jgi:hypothetical protein
VPGWMIANDDGGDSLQIGTSTIFSYNPPPMAAAVEKHRRTKDQVVNVGAWCVIISVLLAATRPAGGQPR